jgi:hypothetical protein
MSAPEPINYEAVLADLKARREQLNAAIASVEAILGQLGSGPGPGSGPHGGPHPKPDAFLKMTIPDATAKHLATVREKQSTKQIIDALVKGGLPPSSYQTVYGILLRREKQVGDIFHFKGGDWALSEWYPNRARPSAKGTKPAPNGQDEIKADKVGAA